MTDKKKFTNDWFSYNINLFAYLMTLTKKNPTILEIGCYEGLATSWLLENNPKSTVYAVDPWITMEFYENYEKNFNHNVKPFKDRLVKMKMFSDEGLRKLQEDGVKFDFVYIDGDHTALGVMKDIIGVLPLLNDGAIVHFDDYLWDKQPSTPKPAIDWFLENCKENIEVIHRGYQLAIKRKHL